MRILIDYGNLSQLDKKRGLSNYIFHLVDTIGAQHLQPNQYVDVRLYGGWYDADTLSRQAQELATELAEDFPKPIPIAEPGRHFHVRTNASLARSLLCDPSRDIMHTFRVRNFPSGLNCVSPPFSGCNDHGQCPIASLHKFIHNRECPADSCTVHPKTIITRAEQKIVDTMMTSDIIHSALSGEQLAVVSSDDDLWPGIRLALAYGKRVLHIHTRKGQTTPAHYKTGLDSKYIELDCRS